MPTFPNPSFIHNENSDQAICFRIFKQKLRKSFLAYSPEAKQELNDLVSDLCEAWFRAEKNNGGWQQLHQNFNSKAAWEQAEPFHCPTARFTTPIRNPQFINDRNHVLTLAFGNFLCELTDNFIPKTPDAKASILNLICGTFEACYQYMKSTERIEALDH